jgi:hypothetical protein
MSINLLQSSASKLSLGVRVATIVGGVMLACDRISKIFSTSASRWAATLEKRRLAKKFSPRQQNEFLSRTSKTMSVILGSLSKDF